MRTPLRRASLVAPLLVLLTALVAFGRPAGAAVETHLLRIDPRAGHPGHESTPIWPHDIRYDVQVQTSASDEQLAELFEAVERNCPILNLLRNPQHIEGRVVRVGGDTQTPTKKEAVAA